MEHTIIVVFAAILIMILLWLFVRSLPVLRIQGWVAPFIWLLLLLVVLGVAGGLLGVIHL